MRIGVVLAVVAVVLVVGGALGYLGAGLAVVAGERTAANGVMRSAGADTLKLGGVFVSPKNSGASSQNDIGQSLVHATQLSHGGHVPPQYLAMMTWHTTLQADSQKMLQALHD